MQRYFFGPLEEEPLTMLRRRGYDALGEFACRGFFSSLWTGSRLHCWRAEVPMLLQTPYVILPGGPPETPKRHPAVEESRGGRAPFSKNPLTSPLQRLHISGGRLSGRRAEVSTLLQMPACSRGRSRRSPSRKRSEVLGTFSVSDARPPSQSTSTTLDSL